MFKSVLHGPVDPIFGILEEFIVDPCPNKINLGIGVYKDEFGNTPILNSVKQAEKILLEYESSKNYLNIDGLTNFIINIQQLLFSNNGDIVNNGRVCSVQTLGGTGALRIAADFLFHNTTVRTIWISNPSWPNHKNIFCFAGFQIKYYNYYDKIAHKLNFSVMMKDLEQANIGDIIILHGCCHNPTGADLTSVEWNELANFLLKKELLPLLDISYQGFASSLEEDTIGLRIFYNILPEIIICSSYSKNFGLYNERIGACTIVTSNRLTTKRVLSQLKTIIRANYSSPPAHGGAIISTILSNNILRKMWEEELNIMRTRIQNMRELYLTTIVDYTVRKDFSFIKHQKGMFAFIDFYPSQIYQLRKKLSIYILDSGRMNIAGINKNNVHTLCRAISMVL